VPEDRKLRRRLKGIERSLGTHGLLICGNLAVLTLLVCALIRKGVITGQDLLDIGDGTGGAGG
jgi:hypothetical protein